MLNTLTLMAIDDGSNHVDSISDEDLTYLELDMLSAGNSANELLRADHDLRELQSAVENDLSMESYQYAQLTLDCILGKEAIYIGSRRYDEHLIDVTMESDDRGILRKIWDAIVKFAKYIKDIVVKLYTKVADFFKNLFGKKKELDSKLNDAKKAASATDDIKADDVEKEAKNKYNEKGQGADWKSAADDVVNNGEFTDATKEAIEVTKKVLKDTMYVKGNKKYETAMKEKHKIGKHFRGLLPIKGDIAYIYSLKKEDFRYMSPKGKSNGTINDINSMLMSMEEGVGNLDSAYPKYHDDLSSMADNLDSITVGDMAQTLSTSNFILNGVRLKLPAAKQLNLVPMLESNLGKAFLAADKDAAYHIKGLKVITIVDSEIDKGSDNKDMAIAILKKEYDLLLESCSGLSKAIDKMSHMPKLFEKSRKKNVIEVKVNDSMSQDKVKEMQTKMRIYNHMAVGDIMQYPVDYIRTVMMTYRRVVNLLHEASQPTLQLPNKT